MRFNFITNPDIWAEILQYFRVHSLVNTSKSGKESAAENRSRCRQTLLSVALTCSGLAGPALAELWRTLPTLEYAVWIYETSPALTLSGPSFKYEVDGYWILNVTPEQRRILAPRLQTYLRRIRYLHFERFPSNREYTLWPILHALSGSSYICPNLKGLLLPLKNVPPDLIIHLSPLISPSIEELKIEDAEEAENEKSAAALLNIFRAHGTTALRELSYKGFTSPCIYEQTSHFLFLRKLELRFRPKANLTLVEASDIQCLRNFSRLTSLSLDSRAFSWDAVEVVGQWIGMLEMLTELTLEGSWKSICHCAFKGTIFQHVLCLRLMPSSPASSDLFSLIPPAFPTLRSFGIQVNWSARADSSSEFRLSDIMALKNHPMKYLVLCHLPLAISSEDISKLLVTWPSLETLYLVPDEVIKSGFFFDAKLALAQISGLGARLKTLLLPLNLISLAAATPMSLPLPNSPLRRLIIFLADNIPEDWKEQQKLVANLLKLFPRLTNIDVIESHFGKPATGDLQRILDIFQQLLLSPPRRPDCLFLN